MNDIADGTPVWKATVSQVLTGWGLHVYTLEGTVAHISTGPVVVHKAGCSHDIENWHTSREAALAKAADDIEILISPAVRQIARLREG
jgi:hypothetical protein